MMKSLMAGLTLSACVLLSGCGDGGEDYTFIESRSIREEGRLSNSESVTVKERAEPFIFRGDEDKDLITGSDNDRTAPLCNGDIVRIATDKEYNMNHIKLVKCVNAKAGNYRHL